MNTPSESQMAQQSGVNLVNIIIKKSFKYPLKKLEGPFING